MNKFSIVMDGEIKQVRRFFFSKKTGEGQRHFLIRLIGIKLGEKGITPIYLPLLATEWRKDIKQFYFELALSRWKSIVVVIDRNGIHPKFFDLLKEYDDE